LKIVSESSVATDSETINDIASTAIAWIHHLTNSLLTLKWQEKTQSLPNQKPSTTLLPQLTRGLVSAKDPVDF
jgi:hypothetical protein